jgi:TPP-dependent pyruvate/acetoin dehydrogenase alpha subunit
VVRFEQTLIEAGLATASDFESIQSRARRDVDTATDEAERSPMPRPEEAGMGLYAGDGYWEEQR